MRKLTILGIITIFAIVGFTACEDWVQDVDPQIDRIEDNLLNDPDQIPFLITGVEARFAFVNTRLTLSADLLAHQLIFDTAMENATFPTYRDLYNNFRGVGDQTIFASNTVRGFYTPLGGFRLLADDLVERASSLEGVEPAVLNEALFVGNFYGAVARYFIGFHMAENACGADAGVGSGGQACINANGGPIDGSASINAPDMFDNEIEPLLTNALAAATPAQSRIINSFRARMLLFLGRHGAAYTAAQNGMVEGDAPFNGLHSVQAANEFFFAAGDGRIQALINQRFGEYVEDDPTEAGRVAIRDTVGAASGGPYQRKMQDLYPVQASPMRFLSWQENELMLAELEALHGQGTAATALLRVNDVRDSHGVSPYVGTLDADFFLEERDKELMLRGIRMFDLLRFNAWPSTIGGTDNGVNPEFGQPVGPWRGLPIPNDERNDNPNVG